MSPNPAMPSPLPGMDPYLEDDKLWPGFSKHVKATHVYTYHPTSLAVWPPGRSPIDEQSELVRTPELGMYLAGDWTMSSHSDGAAKSGINVAKQIAPDEMMAGPSAGRTTSRVTCHVEAPSDRAASSSAGSSFSTEAMIVRITRGIEK